MHDYLIALGANVPTGNSAPVDTLEWALTSLAAKGVEVEAVSAFYATPAYPAGSGPDFANAAARVKSSLAAADFLALLHQIEADAGRQRVKRWGPRVLDLDLLAEGARILPDSAVLTVTVDNVNDPPNANPDVLTVNEDTNNNVVDVLDNDDDPDGDTLTITGASATNGTIDTSGKSSLSSRSRWNSANSALSTSSS